jgi:hypothetical protein
MPSPTFPFLAVKPTVGYTAPMKNKDLRVKPSLRGKSPGSQAGAERSLTKSGR